jgi:hypothetical protein
MSILPAHINAIVDQLERVIRLTKLIQAAVIDSEKEYGQSGHLLSMSIEDLENMLHNILNILS